MPKSNQNLVNPPRHTRETREREREKGDDERWMTPTIDPRIPQHLVPFRTTTITATTAGMLRILDP